MPLVTRSVDETPGWDEVNGTKSWAHVGWDVEEEWMQVWLSPDLEKLTRAQVEHIILHEVTHVLFAFAKASDATEEMACNRVAGLLIGPEHGVRSVAATLDLMSALDSKAARQYFDDDEREVLLEAMPHLIVRLAPKHREVLCGLFYEGKSLKDLADEWGITKPAVAFRRDHAIEALREMFLAEGGGASE